MSNIKKIENKIVDTIRIINANNAEVVFGTFVTFGKPAASVIGKSFPALLVVECRKVKAAPTADESSDTWNLLLEATKPLKQGDISDSDEGIIVAEETDVMAQLDDCLDAFFKEFTVDTDAEWLIISEIIYDFDAQSHVEGNVSVFARLSIKCFGC